MSIWHARSIGMSCRGMLRASNIPVVFLGRRASASVPDACAIPRSAPYGQPGVDTHSTPWRFAGAAAASLFWLALASPSRTEDQTDIAEHWLQRLGPEAKALDLSLRRNLLANRQDKQFIWQTCSGDRGIQDCKFFVCNHNQDSSDNALGKTRICAVVRVGDTLNGHVGLLHGGFTAAILDDMTGLTTYLEKDAREMGRDAKIFTANLSVNYRRPLPCNSEYFVDVRVDRIEKNKKIYLTATIYNEPGHACVEASALYIVKQ
eukprot:TRINITY_DN45383_c0_g1_i1.p1 TRINITY_DN45383_c0_g1~~TRINITY_DN45383_c0_g1_i1.p1  ORF type:complete len:262 (+),score=28.82 TRINITY_DN45383_c0_g1_i1:40-825(+)